MIFPQKGIDAIRALYKASPQDEAARKHDIQVVGEQMCFDLGSRWGNKQRTGVNSRSADSIAYLEDNDTVSVWDIQASNGDILVSAGDPPKYPNLPPSEADFIDCIAFNHMGTEPIPIPEPEPPSNNDDIMEVLNQVILNQEEFKVQQQLILDTVNMHTQMLTDILNQGTGTGFLITYPDYVMRIFGQDVKLTPVPRHNP